MLVFVMKAQLDRGKLHPEKVPVKGKAGTFQSTRWKGQGKPPEGKHATAKPRVSDWVRTEDKPKPEYQPQNLPGMGVGFADIPPEKRFDTVWIQSARQLIEFSPSTDTTLKRLMELQQLMWGSGGESLTFDRALDTASAEFEYMLGEEEKGTDIGREWYRADVKRARAALSAIYPTLSQDGNWEMFVAQLALLSPTRR